MTMGAETAIRGGAGAPDLSRLLRKASKHVPALGVALVVNLGLLALVAFSPRTRPIVESAPIEITLVGSAVRPKPAPPPSPSVRVGARPRSSPIRPELLPREVKPLVLPPPVAEAPSRWAVKPGGGVFGDLDRAVVPSIRLKRGCEKGAFAGMTASEREACRLLRFKPDGPVKPAYPLKDPGGEWAKAAQRQEDRRRPLTQPPVHDCHTDKAMNNLASGCTD